MGRCLKLERHNLKALPKLHLGPRESSRTGEMSYIAQIDTSANPAESMTKVNPTSYLLTATEITRLDHVIAQEEVYGQVERRIRLF